MSAVQVEISEVTEYEPGLAEGLGLLIPDLVSDHDGSPVERELLEEIVGSNRSALFVATAPDERLVGTATVNLITHPLKRKGYLDYLIVSSDPEVRGRGVGQRLWLAAGRWCLNKGAVKMEWTSNYDRVDAHAFYARQGARIKDTAFFEVDLAPEVFNP